MSSATTANEFWSGAGAYKPTATMSGSSRPPSQLGNPMVPRAGPMPSWNFQSAFTPYNPVSGGGRAAGPVSPWIILSNVGSHVRTLFVVIYCCIAPPHNFSCWKEIFHKSRKSYGQIESRLNCCLLVLLLNDCCPFRLTKIRWKWAAFAPVMFWHLAHLQVLHLLLFVIRSPPWIKLSPLFNRICVLLVSLAVKFNFNFTSWFCMAFSLKHN